MKEITAIRLQPLMYLKQNKIYGYEVLSELDQTADYTQWFQRLRSDELVALWRWQQGCLTPLMPSVKLLQNMTLSVLTSPVLIQEITAQPSRSQLELQDPENLQNMDEAAIKTLQANLLTLRAARIPLWLDDYRPEYDVQLERLALLFDGIKIDYHEFHARRRSPAALAALIAQSRRFGKMTLVEGIENKKDMETAWLSGACLGQGFFWPEVKISPHGAA